LADRANDHLKLNLSKNMTKVIITSQNPAKIKAVEAAFKSMFKHEKFEFVGVKVSSDVSDQPMSSSETKQGAINRINNAKKEIQADYYVSLEGGLDKDLDGYLQTINWSAIEHQGSLSLAHSASFKLPDKIAQLIHRGSELGTAAEATFGTVDVKHDLGMVGVLAHGVVNRSQYVIQSVQLALIPFVNKDLY
jgi:inosine/xanthosine triphosphatase